MMYSWVNVIVFVLFVLIMWVAKGPKKAPHPVINMTPQPVRKAQMTQAEMLARSSEKLRESGIEIVRTHNRDTYWDDRPLISLRDEISPEKYMAREEYRAWVANCARVAELAESEVYIPEAPGGIGKFGYQVS